jgi:ssDNA thymidine ADP-ribosyltransferase, DarT
MPAPAHPKIYHIVHVDRLASIIGDGCLWSDAVMAPQEPTGTTIGMNDIKFRRLHRLSLTSHPDLKVGDCVPFYFCPRSVMLYLIWQANHPNLTYRGGQGPIVHLEADLRAAVAWADQNRRRWAFTLSNAGAYYFEDRCTLDQLHEINWDAVQTRRWSGRNIAESLKEGKQAEFLMCYSFPWRLVERVGVYSRAVAQQVAGAMLQATHRPVVEIQSGWYY